MHLRAHSVVSRFFAELKDAPSNPSLALCTSTVLFVLSQDRLNMDMDRDSLGDPIFFRNFISRALRVVTGTVKHEHGQRLIR
jgi:hypothetical protein